MRSTRMGRTGHLMVAGVGLLVSPALAGPLPQGASTITVSYDGGPGPFSGARDYQGRLGDQTPLGQAPNISAFNSAGNQIGVFGRRADPILLADPERRAVLGENETLISHAFFKIDVNGDFFPGITEGGRVNVSIDNIQFAEPVTLLPETLMLHVKWNGDQVFEFGNQTGQYYQHLDDHFTATDPFRDFDLFNDPVTGGPIFFDGPVPNYVLGEPGFDWSVMGNGTDKLSLSFSFPYELLRNLEDVGHDVPPGLPAPHGFLEPFHFHVEYVVVPEPTTLALLLFGAGVLIRRSCTRR